MQRLRSPAADVPHGADISIRLVWPFARVLGPSNEALAHLEEVGIDVASFANPDTRVPHRVVMELLTEAVRRTGDVTLGLRAGAGVEALDFDILERVARTAPTLRDGISCMARYFRLLHGAAEIRLEEQADRAMFSYRVTDDVPQPPQANDFVIAAALGFGKRNTNAESNLREIWLMHEKPSYHAEYEKVARARVRFGAPVNGLILERARLDAPMVAANEKLSAVIEAHAKTLLERLRQTDGVKGRVRERIAAEIGVRVPTMAEVARKLAMSVATLRRRLEEEGTTYSDLVDDLRRDLAQQYLRDPRTAVSEVAFILGFANAGAFHRAFRRWTGVAPSEYRARLRAH